MVDDILQEAEERMKKALVDLDNGFANVRTGRANAMLLDHITVDYYGVPTPINQTAAIKVPEAHLMTITPWDKGMLGPIEHAISESNLGITPNNDGSCIRLNFPQPTKERRQELVKTCKEYAEEARVAVRGARQKANSAIADLVKSSDLPEDDQHRAEGRVQKLTDSYIAKVDQAFKDKEAEVMEI